MLLKCVNSKQKILGCLRTNAVNNGVLTGKKSDNFYLKTYDLKLDSTMNYIRISVDKREKKLNAR